LNPDKAFSKEESASLKSGDSIEVQSRAMVLVNAISELISKTNGAALIIDYGEDHAFSESFRAIRKHKIIQKPYDLSFPGEADFSAYVNFRALKRAAESVPGIRAEGPMPQGLFLESMGITTRLEQLSLHASRAAAQRLEAEYQRIVSPEQMGANFKFLYIGRTENGDVFPFIRTDLSQTYY